MVTDNKLKPPGSVVMLIERFLFLKWVHNFPQKQGAETMNFWRINTNSEAKDDFGTCDQWLAASVSISQ